MKIKNSTAGYIALFFFAALLLSTAGRMPREHHHARSYTSFSEMYKSVGDAEYARLYNRASYLDQGDMVAAADKACHGALHEDFSCSEAEEEGNALRPWTKYEGDDKKALARIDRQYEQSEADSSEASGDTEAAISPSSEAGTGTTAATEITVGYSGRLQANLSAAMDLYASGKTIYTTTPVTISRTNMGAGYVNLVDEPGLQSDSGHTLCGQYRPASDEIALNTALMFTSKCPDPTGIITHELAHSLYLEPHHPDPENVPQIQAPI